MPAVAVTIFKFREEFIIIIIIIIIIINIIIIIMYPIQFEQVKCALSESHTITVFYFWGINSGGP